MSLTKGTETETGEAVPEGGARGRLRRFFWAETSGEAGALFRIGFGALVIYYLVVLVGWNLTRYYGDSGVLPHSVFSRWVGRTTLLALGSSQALLWGVWGVTLAAAIAFTVGFRARIAAVVLYVGLLSIQNRNPYVANAAEGLICALAFLSILAPLSLRSSFDARREGPRTAPVFGLRLVQLQLVIVYVTSVIHKLQEPLWRSGEAVRFALDAKSLSNVSGGLGSTSLEHALTWGTLVLEGLFFLVFWKRLRPWVLAAGVLLHLSIEAIFRIPMFSGVMLVTYLTFLTDEEARRVTGWLARPFSRTRPGLTAPGP